MQQLSAIIDGNLQLASECRGESVAGFGAQVMGFNVSKSLEAASIARIRELLAHYQILVFRDHAITPAMQRWFTRLFGDQEPGITRRPAGHQVEGFPGVLRLSNAPGSQTISYGQSWHSDGLAYARVPHGVTILSCKACPNSMGDTLFASQALAHAAMPVELRKAIADMQWLLPPMPFSEVPPGKALVQPMVRRHKLTSKEFVFCAPNARRILGLSEAQSAPVLACVRRYQLAQDYQYRHCWQPNDLVVWENCALLHARADVVEYQGQGLREMHRTATAGSYAAMQIEFRGETPIIEPSVLGSQPEGAESRMG